MTDQPELEVESSSSSAAQSCVCGEPADPAVVHRSDGPCYVATPADQPSLRDRIAGAVRGVMPMSSSLACDVVADAVLAVLPEPADVPRLQARILELEADLAKVRDLLRTENKRANDAIGREETAEQAAREAFADRAAALWASAGPLGAAGIEGKPDMNVKALHVHAHDDADLADLHSMADEAQQPEHSCGNCEGVDPDTCLSSQGAAQRPAP